MGNDVSTGAPQTAEPRFVRLHWSRISVRTGQPQGVFAAISTLEQASALSEAEHRRVATIARMHGVDVHEAVADCPGTVVYEDAFQVAVVT